MSKKSTYRLVLTKTHRFMLFLGVAALLSGLVFQLLYNYSSHSIISIRSVELRLQREMQHVDRKIQKVQTWLDREEYESVQDLAFVQNNFTLLIYRNDSLLFWSDNQINPIRIDNSEWELMQLSNAYALVRSYKKNDFHLVVYLPVKHDYPYENEELINEYVSFVNLSPTVALVKDEPGSPYAIHDRSGTYLFSLEIPPYSIPDQKFADFSFYSYSIFFLILFYLFAHLPLFFGRKKLNVKQFFLFAIGFGVVVFLMLRFDFPKTFFQNKLFTPFHFASLTVISTLTHLSFFSFYLFSTIYLYKFFASDKIEGKTLVWLRVGLLLLVPVAYFFLVFNLLSAVVFGSTVEMNVQRVENLNFLAAYNYLIFLLWGGGFFFLQRKTRKMLLEFIEVKKLLALELLPVVLLMVLSLFAVDQFQSLFVISFLLLSSLLYLTLLFPSDGKAPYMLALWLIGYTFFIAVGVYIMNKQKKFDRNRILAENYFLDGDHEDLRLAVVLIDDLDTSITWDNRLKKLVRNSDSLVVAADYLNETYMRGFWRKYKIHLFVADQDSELATDYENELDRWGKQIAQTHFYTMDNPALPISFLGVFHLLDERQKQINLYLEFHPRRYHKSYSYPKLLLDAEPSLLTKHGLSNARYEYRRLVSSSGKYTYPDHLDWIEGRDKVFFTYDANGYRHYIYAPDAYNRVILSEVQNNSLFVYLIYFIYVFLFFICCSYLAQWGYRLLHRGRNRKRSVSSRFLYTFTLLLILSFGSIFYISVGFFRQKYLTNHVESLEQTKSYIQNTLQEKYPWVVQLDSTLRNELIFDLQDISYTYRTDIHVYDNSGMLVASSQMPLFNRELVSDLIAPAPFFSNMENYSQSERIGKLEYLTAYTDFYNMDFMPVGYIAVPQFLSEDQIREEMLDFLSAIVHIFIAISMLFVVLSVIIGRQLSAPLIVLEESLKEMKVGRENRKIEYKPKDEVGQLVEQYNKTVEELEESVRQLAQSERESAWKTMARQVAHEINNPLTPMKLTIQQMQRRKAMGDEHFDSYFDEASVVLIEQIDNLTRIAGSFSSFAKLPDSKFDFVNVGQVLKSVVTLFRSSNEQINLQFSDCVNCCWVLGDREQLIQVFNNLLKNAEHALQGKKDGKIEIFIVPNDTHTVIEIKDNGAGIPEEIRDQLFTPNFTTKSSGMGLGLAISKKIVDLMGGEIHYETEYNKGTSFFITLPLVEVDKKDGLD